MRPHTFSLIPTIAAVAVVGCASPSTSSILGLTPASGVLVSAASLTAEYGCGIGDQNVYKYAAILSSSDGTFKVSQLYDCYADANFVNIQEAPDGGTLKLAIQIIAFNKASYDVQNIDEKLQKAAEIPDTISQAKPTYTSTCEVSQPQGVQSTAVCTRLQPPKP